MNYKDKPIADLTDDELRDAILAIVDIDKNRLDKLDAQRKRHKKIFETHPAVENPIFTQLVAELNRQFQLRNLTNI